MEEIDPSWTTRALHKPCHRSREYTNSFTNGEVKVGRGIVMIMARKECELARKPDLEQTKLPVGAGQTNIRAVPPKSCV